MSNVKGIKGPMKTAVLMITTPDRPGLTAGVSEFIFKRGINILHADQHRDPETGLFLMRIECDLTATSVVIEEFKRDFEALASQMKLIWDFRPSGEKERIALFVSKYEHCLADLLYRVKSGDLNCEVTMIISNHAENKQWADLYSIPFHQFRGLQDKKEKTEGEMLDLLKREKISTIVLARYMQILSDNFVSHFPNQIINIHHSFLPAFPGARPYHQAYQRGVKLIGATGHYVTGELDNGPIIEQDVIRISHRDTIGDIIQKGRDLEKMVLYRALKCHLERKILVYGDRTVVFN